LGLNDEKFRDALQPVYYGCATEQVGFIYTFPLSQNSTPVQTKGIARAELETDS
jgi:hypothetical protein